MKKKSKAQKVEEENDKEFMIKPEKSTPKLDTSKWPLLLKVTTEN
jgi:H/ACA ribonucleoprotein complex subunit 4